MGSQGEELLVGGVAHAGLVVRVGDTVRRPAGPQTSATSRLLLHLESVGFEGAPRFLGLDDQGREVLSYVSGDVPLSPYPPWSMTDAVLVAVARLLRRYHDAVSSLVREIANDWSTELADPIGSDVLCHNDVCPENVVFRGGAPVALLDFDFAAPGRRVWDIAFTAGMWAPFGAPHARRHHPRSLDGIARTATFVRAYGLESFDADEFIGAVDVARQVGRRFVEGRIAKGEPAFIEMVANSGGEKRRRMDREWWSETRDVLRAAVS
jgi:hypothetical protein